MTRSGRVLVVDDEVNARTTLADLLRDEGYEVEMAADAFKAIGKYEAFAPQVVVTDFQMPGMDGLELLKRIRAADGPAAVIVMTAFGAVQTAVEAMRAGAADYLTKPIDFDELLIVLDRVFELQYLRREVRQFRARGAPTNLIGGAPALQRIFETIGQVAASRATVLVTGEPGTGKESIAHAIHQASPRARRPLIKVHCAGLADPVLDAELFGYERGAFTGALIAKDGALVQADGGTLFLDEVAEMPAATQVRLLRFLQDQELERLGGSHPIRVDVRLIAATTRDLADEVAKGRFREDLFYRLRVVAIVVPPLRERISDIPALAKFFIHRYGKLNGKTIEDLSPDALESLVSYDWPGNVRELESAIESAVVLSKGTTLEARALPSAIQPAIGGLPRIPGSTMAEIERYVIVETMKATGGSTSRAAEILGISTRTIQYRLHQYNEAPRSDQDVVKRTK